jgi:hypothetical protein
MGDRLLDQDSRTVGVGSGARAPGSPRDGSYTLIAMHATILMVGGHYTYAAGLVKPVAATIT